MPIKKWYRFNGGPITYWGQATPAQAIEYNELRCERYPGSTYTEVAGEPSDEGRTIINVDTWLPAPVVEVAQAESEPWVPECSKLPADWHILSVRDVVDMLSGNRLDARLRVVEGQLVIEAELKHWNHNSGLPFAVFHVSVSNDGIVQRQDYMSEIAGYLLRLTRGQSLPAPYLAMAEA